MKIKIIYFSRQAGTYTMVVCDPNGHNESKEIAIGNDAAEAIISNFKIEKYDSPDFIHYSL